jgi:hypothetical protein
MLIGPPVLEISQKELAVPEALISTDVPAKLAAGAQTRARTAANAILFFMEKERLRRCLLRGNYFLTQGNLQGQV